MFEKILSILVNLVSPQTVTKEDLFKFIILFLDMGLFVISLFFILVLRLSKNKTLKKLIKFLIVGIVIFILIQIIVYADMRIIEPNWIKLEKITLKIPRLAKAIGNMKIVHISDLHVVNYGYREKSLIEIINRINPDIVFFTGGMSRDDNDIKQFEGFLKLMSHFKPKYGIWMTPDYTDKILFIQYPKLKEGIKSMGIKILENENVKFLKGSGEGFWLIGVGDSSERADNLNAAMWKVSIDEPKIMITHAPTVADKIAEYDVDLLLAGDTQGGQCGIALIRNQSGYVRNLKYLSGVYKVKNTFLYVNRGIGVKTSQYRLFCRPEVTLFNITN